MFHLSIKYIDYHLLSTLKSSLNPRTIPILVSTNNIPFFISILAKTNYQLTKTYRDPTAANCWTVTGHQQITETEYHSAIIDEDRGYVCMQVLVHIYMLMNITDRWNKIICRLRVLETFGWFLKTLSNHFLFPDRCSIKTLHYNPLIIYIIYFNTWYQVTNRRWYLIFVFLLVHLYCQKYLIYIFNFLINIFSIKNFSFYQNDFSSRSNHHGCPHLCKVP